MIFDQLSFLCLPQDTTSIFAASPHIRPPQDTTASMASHSGFLSRALLSSEPVVYYVLYLIYLANVSLSDFLALLWILLLTAPSARSCKVRESVIHLLATLLGVLRRAFLLLYQRTSFATLLLVFQSTSFTAAANNNNNFLIRTNSNCHYNSNYLLDAALHTTTVTGMTTDNAESPLNTALHTTTVTGVSTGNPTLAPHTWVTSNSFSIDPYATTLSNNNRK